MMATKTKTKTSYQYLPGANGLAVRAAYWASKVEHRTILLEAARNGCEESNDFLTAVEAFEDAMAEVER